MYLFSNKISRSTDFFLPLRHAATMSTQSAVRHRSQKHSNKTKWDATRFKKSDDKAKKAQSVVVTNCCSRCTDVIQWKIE